MITAFISNRTLKMRRPLHTTQGKVSVRRVQVLVLQDEAGNVGYGEAAPLPVYGSEDPVTCAMTLDRVVDQLPALAERWLQRDWPAATLGPLEKQLANTPCARACVEGALLDLWARRHGHLLADILRPPDDTTPLLRSLPVNGILAGLTGEELGETASEAVAKGWRCFKLKVGEDAGLALEQIRALRSWVGDKVQLRVDADGLWDRDAAKSFVVRGRGLDLEYLEQPLPSDDLEGLKALRRQATWPIAVDESIRRASDVAGVAAHEAADIIVLKPMALGGWRPTRQAADLARSLGLEVVVTSFIDGAIGRALATHMAAALGLSDRAQGLATGPLLANDLTDQPLRAKAGILTFRDDAGLGIGTLLPEMV